MPSYADTNVYNACSKGIICVIFTDVNNRNTKIYLWPNEERLVQTPVGSLTVTVQHKGQGVAGSSRITENAGKAYVVKCRDGRLDIYNASTKDRRTEASS